MHKERAVLDVLQRKDFTSYQSSAFLSPFTENPEFASLLRYARDLDRRIQVCIVIFGAGLLLIFGMTTWLAALLAPQVW
jgi:hypothetical protein